MSTVLEPVRAGDVPRGAVVRVVGINRKRAVTMSVEHADVTQGGGLVYLRGRMKGRRGAYVSRFVPVDDAVTVISSPETCGRCLGTLGWTFDPAGDPALYHLDARPPWHRPVPMKAAG